MGEQMSMIDRFYSRKQAGEFAKHCTWKPHGAFASALHVRGMGILGHVIRDHENNWRAYGPPGAGGLTPRIGESIMDEAAARTAAWDAALAEWVRREEAARD